MLLLCAQITDRGADTKLLPDMKLALGSWLLPLLWWRRLLLKESRITSPREVNSGWCQIACFRCPTFNWKGLRDRFLFAFCHEHVLPQWLLWELGKTPRHRRFHLLSATICPDQPGSWDASSSPLQLPFNVWCTILSLGLRSARLKYTLWITSLI